MESNRQSCIPYEDNPGASQDCGNTFPGSGKFSHLAPQNSRGVLLEIPLSSHNMNPGPIGLLYYLYVKYTHAAFVACGLKLISPWWCSHRDSGANFERTSF